MESSVGSFFADDSAAVGIAPNRSSSALVVKGGGEEKLEASGFCGVVAESVSV